MGDIVNGEEKETDQTTIIENDETVSQLLETTETSISLFRERLSSLQPGTETHQMYAEAALRISLQMKEENGTNSAMEWFHSNLPVTSMQCDLLPDLPARFFLKRDGLKVSTVALVVILAKRKREQQQKQQQHQQEERGQEENEKEK